MDTPLISIDSLRAYPPWLVMSCVVVLMGCLCWLTAKLLKWSIYALLAGVFVAVLIVVWMWLWG